MTGDDLASAYDYALPQSLIAQHPAAVRDASRLLVLPCAGTPAHRVFADLPDVLQRGDLLVLNDTRVIAARLRGTREPTGGAAELLLLHPAHTPRYDPRADTWVALARPGRRLRRGAVVRFSDAGCAVITAERADGLREVRFDIDLPFETFLERAGRLPLPPYIHDDDDESQRRYQTIFARVPGSVAAPTASLHFTPDVIERARARGVELAYVTLDVGLGTFRPMKTLRVDEHVMHAEHYAIAPETAASIERAKREGRRIVAAGTTVVRTLEGCALEHGAVRAGEGRTALFIRPGFNFAVVDAMITNFHLPQSTLLVLVSAFAGRERVLAAYREAVAHSYRFFSFGDAMFVERCPAAPHRTPAS